MEERHIELQIHHAGYFERSTKQYCNGQIHRDVIVEDKFSWFEITGVCMDAGYVDKSSYSVIYKTKLDEFIHLQNDEHVRWVLNQEPQIGNVTTVIHLYLKDSCHEDVLGNACYREYNPILGDYIEDESEYETEMVFKPIAKEEYFFPIKRPRKKELREKSNGKFNVEAEIIRCNRAEIPSIIHVGDRFDDARHFREMLRLDAVKRFYDFRFKKNDDDRIRVICNDPREECPFKLYASRCSDGSAMQIKSMISAHTCARLTKNPQVTSTFLAKFHLNKFRDDPNLDLFGLRQSTIREIEVEPSKDQLYKCKQKAMNIIVGDWETQYNKLYNYANILLQRNPGSIIKLSHTLDDPPQFRRFFCAFEGLTKGFLAGCRPWIGLDGTFLKKSGQNYGQGELLTAVGRDPNLEIYPIAYCFVEGENFDAWKWFLSCLADALGRPDLHEFTFMSDRQKGLLKVFDECYPGIEHRYCLRHLYDNLKLKKDLLHKEIFVAANIGNQLRFTQHWLEIKRLSPEAVEMLEKVGFKAWAKHAFNPLVLNDSITNNISETWNRVLLPARQRPILSMLEWIRRKLMTRLQSKREKMEKYTGVICPGIIAEIEKLKQGLKRCNVRFSGNDEFEVDEINELDMYTYVVDLKKYQCDCGIWGLSGIPCLHVLKCITSYNLRVEEYVHPTYYKEKHLMAYSGIIHPIPDESLWDDLMRGKMLPPPWRNPPGRPKGKRRKGPNEQSNPNKMTRNQETIKCKKCEQSGHNIRTCQNDHVVPPPKRISKGGKPKCDVMERVCRAEETIQGEPKQKRKYTRKTTYKSADVARSFTQNPFDINLRGIQRRWKSKKKLKALRESESTDQEQQTYNEVPWSPHMQELSNQLTQTRVSFETMLRDPTVGFNFLMENAYEASSSALTRENIYNKSSSTQESDNDAQMTRMYSQSSASCHTMLEMRRHTDFSAGPL